MRRNFSLLLYATVLSVLITIQKGISKAPGMLPNQGAPLLRLQPADTFACSLQGLAAWQRPPTMWDTRCAFFSRPPSPKILVHTLTWAARTRYMKSLDWLVQTWQPCKCEPVCLVGHKPIEMAICALLVSDESKNVFFVLPAPLSSENADSNPFAPGDFEASRVVFWSLSCYKELKLTTNRFAGRTLRGLLIQMQNISLRSSGMRRKQNFEIKVIKSDTAVLTFTFRFLSSLLFSLFLPHFFFSSWAFSRLHFGGKSF